MANVAPGDSTDEKVKCPLSRFVPNVPETAAEQKKMALGWERGAYIFVVEQLWEHPKLKRDTAAFVKGAVESLKKEELACANELKEDVSSFGRYDQISAPAT